MEKWNGRVALVTGASKGIGADILKELVKHGMIVVGCARNITNIQALVRDKELSKGPGKLYAIKRNLGKEDAIFNLLQAIRKKFGRVDLCITNSLFTTHSPFVAGDAWSHMMEANILDMRVFTQESLNLMMEKNIEDGQIIHIGRNCFQKIPVNPKDKQRLCNCKDCETKSAVRSVAESVLRDLNATSSRIRVALVGPGVVDTETLHNTFCSEFLTASFFCKESLDRKDIRDVCIKSKDIVDAVIYILSRPFQMNEKDVTVQPMTSLPEKVEVGTS